MSIFSDVAVAISSLLRQRHSPNMGRSQTRNNLSKLSAHNGIVFPSTGIPTGPISSLPVDAIGGSTYGISKRSGKSTKRISGKTTRRFNTPERSIQTIASVSRVAWRPGFKNQIASCASVLDNRVQLWSTLRPHVPLACIKGHRDVTTGFFWANQGCNESSPAPALAKNANKGILTSLSEARLFESAPSRSRSASASHKRYKTDSSSIARQAHISSTMGAMFDSVQSSPRRHTSDDPAARGSMNSPEAGRGL